MRFKTVHFMNTCVAVLLVLINRSFFITIGYYCVLASCIPPHMVSMSHVLENFLFSRLLCLALKFYYQILKPFACLSPKINKMIDFSQIFETRRFYTRLVAVGAPQILLFYFFRWTREFLAEKKQRLR
jgi:hypothetical protein